MNQEALTRLITINTDHKLIVLLTNGKVKVFRDLHLITSVQRLVMLNELVELLITTDVKATAKVSQDVNFTIINEEIMYPSLFDIQN